METKTVSPFTENFFSQFVTSKEKLVCININDSLNDAAKLMRKSHVGGLIVCEEKAGKQTPVGVLTDRDITIESLGQDVKPDSLKVSDVMSRTLATAHRNEDLFSMIAKMKENGVNRLPFIDDDGTLSGIVTSKKIVQCLIQGMQDLASLGQQQRQNEKATRH